MIVGKELFGAHTVAAPIGAIHRDRHTGQFRDHMATDQKVGGSSPSEHANVCKCFLEIVLFKNFEGGNEGATQ
jgi:hypothetical protein